MADQDQDVDLFVCVNVDCRSRGAGETIVRLRERLEERGCEHVRMQAIICFAACNLGPNMVIPAKRCWLSGVTPDQVDTVIDLLEGKSVDTACLQENNDPEIDKMIFDMIDAGLLERSDDG